METVQPLELADNVPLLPGRLRPGMTIGLVAPSSPLSEPSVTRGLAHIEDLGFRVLLGRHVRERRGYLAGDDVARAADLIEMLERPDVDAVMCLGGGYGAMRTARALDKDRLRALADRPAKLFVGYSDITALHAMLGRELGWTTFYGPMVHSFKQPSDYTLAAFKHALIEGLPFDVGPAPDSREPQTLVGGQAEGRLAGGCLSILVSLLGTPWEPDFDDAIFFFEDVHEEPYRIDRFLCQLLAAGKLDRCAGILAGEHVDCEPRHPERSLRLLDVFDDLLRPLGVPLLYGLPVGHGKHIATLPLGVRARLDATAQRLKILEPGVR